ncbi:MAG TPA: PTS galactitol transporter subunit IIC [Erysipelotrichaceae bacterium]|nr:PTS sugar transporter subunit IIC [Erysipelotrichaceae bacterium]OGS57911.1 MAG: PTS galactitol transporter subunit IIC [Firmicutes bacterium GWE2_51_13]HAO61712.1 PTS galactitol transporter subunit IIC [Erysipelotrichaceae bacterium]HBZ41955.1 PTS galactitol transporter subunit IIC [Erysipelotrichaceae bacterium]
MEIINYIVGLGSSVMMPIVITLIGLIMGAKPGKAIRAGLTVGVGFIGLNLVIGMLGGNLGPAVQQMVTNYGLSLTVIDVGWPAAAAIAFASQVGALVIPIALAVNFVMIITKTTQTVNIDVWNFWHYAFTGALVSFATDNLVFGLIAAAIQAAITLILADWTAKGVEEYCGLPGVSIPHGLSVAFVPVALVINKILDYIPGINKINMDAVAVQKKFGIFGEPILVGTVLGALIGALAGYDLKGVLNLGITMGAALVLIPKMAGLLMEGLIPISDAASEFVEKRFKSNAKIYIGLDAAVGIGHPTTLAVSLILVPLSVLIAAILPGNQFLPFADLAVLPFLFVLVVPITKGDLFRTLVVGIFIVVTGLWIATGIAPLLTEAAIAANFTMPVGATLISSIADGASPLSWAFVQLMNFKWVGLAVLAAITLGMAFINFKRIAKQAKGE